ncbi:ComEA family DNA-binding protein [Arthrobacter sp. G.S.26]|uniref:ComEA family DNA-binding protein n=1 Tax=Arthrobacter sp. G.S.26 TaxID=3433706 RepID=UPI003D782DF0
MSGRESRAARPPARHAPARLEATVGKSPGLLADVAGDPFEYRNAGSAGGKENAEVPSAGGLRGARLRWRLGLRLAVLLGVLSLLAGAWFWWLAAAGQPGILPLGAESAAGPSPAADGGDPDRENTPDAGPEPSVPGAAAAVDVVVHVAGAVGRPGVVRLPAGSRVQDAVTAAGGSVPGADLDLLNLALVLVDGQKILVPVAGEPLPAAGGGAGGDSGLPDGPAPPVLKVNLNTANAETLATLPKVGPVLAQRIVLWRKEHRPFRTTAELDAVDGVGPKLLEALLPLVTV